MTDEPTRRWMPPLGWPCKQCGRTDLYLSAQKLCPHCSVSRVLETNRQLRAKSGPVYDRWRLKLAQALLGEPDDPI